MADDFKRRSSIHDTGIYSPINFLILGHLASTAKPLCASRRDKKLSMAKVDHADADKQLQVLPEYGKAAESEWPFWEYQLMESF